MAEVLATGSAVVGIIVAAVHSARLLRDDFSAVKNAGESIQPVIDDLSSVIQVLSSLDVTAQSSSQAEEVPNEIDNDNVKTAAQNCNKICTAFRGKLVKWIKHTNNEKMDWRDRFRVGFLGEKEVLEFNRQLVACKGTFTIALQMVTFSLVMRQGQKTDTVIKRLGDANEKINQAGLVVRDRINNLDCQLEGLRLREIPLPGGEERKISQLRVGETNQGPSNSVNDETTQVLSQPSLKEVLDIFENTWKVALADIASRRIKIGKVTQDTDARAVVGAHGLKDTSGMNMQIDDVSVGKRSWAIVGVSEGVDLNSFFK
ncbi:hypothetical protein NHQ30_001323 [Ciborinia camelliae]|nr:hypothetical protein NHQ30_001323 [Ciborinia camelliae]